MMRNLSVEKMLSHEIAVLGTPAIIGAGNTQAGLQEGSVHNAEQFARVLDAGLVSGGEVIFTGMGPSTTIEYPVSEAQGMLDIVNANSRHGVTRPIIEDGSYDTMGNVANVARIVEAREIPSLVVFGAIYHVDRFQELAAKRMPDTKVTTVRTLERTSIKARAREEVLSTLGYLTHIGVEPGDHEKLDAREDAYRRAMRFPKELMFRFGVTERYSDNLDNEAA